MRGDGEAVITMKMLTYLSVMSITPGPNNITCLYLGANGGLRRTARFMMGSMLSLFAKAVLCGLLNLALADVVPQMVAWLKWIGAAYILWLAVHMARSGWREEKAVEGAEGSFVSGVLLQLLNAKSWIGAVSLFAVYVIPVTERVADVIVAAGVFFVIALAASVVWACFGAALRGFIARHRKVFGAVIGLSLVWCAVTAVL